MKRLLIWFTLLVLAIVLFSPLVNAAEDNSWRTEQFTPHVFPIELIRVKDADTMVIKIDLGLGYYTEQSIRIKDYDAPETWRPRNAAEAAHGKQATERAKEILGVTPLRIKLFGWGVYTRPEANIILPDNRIYKDIMIEEGYEKRNFYPD